MGNINNWKKFNEGLKLHPSVGRGSNLRNPQDEQHKFIVSMDSFKDFDSNFDENKFNGFIDDLDSITNSLSDDYGYLLEASRGRYPLPENDTVEYGIRLTIDANSFEEFIDWDILKDNLLVVENLCEENNFKIHIGITWGQDLMPVKNYIPIEDFIQKNQTINDLRKIEIIIF